MEHEFSAATIATPVEEEEQEGGFIEGADDLLRVLPQDLANPQPVLHVLTRRQEELGGGPVVCQVSRPRLLPMHSSRLWWPAGIKRLAKVMLAVPSQ